MSEALAAFIFRWRLPLSAILLAGALLFAPSADITNIDNDITAWFSRDDPVYRDYERFRQEFGGTRSLIIALEAESPDVLFSRGTLRFIEQVSGDIERVETVHRVAGLATATIVEAVPDGLDVRPLLEDVETQAPEEIRRRALEDDLIRGDLVSEDATVTAIVVTFDEDRIDDVRAGVIQTIKDIVDPRLPPGVAAYYNGSLEISEWYNRVTLDNQRKFMPPIFVFTVAAIYLTFRSLRKTVLTVVCIGVSILWALGLYTLLGYTYNVLSSMLAPLIVVLAIADDVHIMQRWEEDRRRFDAEQAFKRTVSHLIAPLLGASATTALGMLSLATSNVVAVRSFGIGSAIGIMMDFVISIVLVPTLLMYTRPELREAPHERYFSGPLRRLARLSCAHAGRVLTISLIVAGTLTLGILRLRVDTNHINFFAAEHPLGVSAAVIDRKLAGVYSFQIMLEGPPDSMKSPEVLRRLDALQEDLRKFPNVRKVTSVADYVRRINKELHDGRPEADVIPADAETIAQELFVFSLGGQGRDEMERIVASDYSRAQVSIKLQSMSSDVVLEQVEEADRRAKAAFAGTEVQAMTTGSGRLFSTLDHYLVISQLSSFGTAFVTVFGVIFIVFRSFRFGLLTIAPNLLPVLAVLGVMGYLDISMNVATIMVASVALGVVDDDTIHFINRYRREVAAGATTDAAIETATVHEGRASLTAAIVNSCGYAVLLTSEYKPTAWFGGLLALTMGVAFLAEVFILPALIKLMPRIYGSDALRRLRRRRLAAAALLPFAIGLFAPPASWAQSAPSGHVSTFVDYLPNRADTAELRARLFVEEKLEPSPSLRVTLSGFAEGLLARRPQTVRDAIARVQDANIEASIGRLDLLAGFARVAWGRLDELQPTDVINPLDVSRFFFEGRGEARLPVALVRARTFLGGDTHLEAVYVPYFRRGRFDQLDEPTSPFNIAALPAAVHDEEPPRTARNGQGGVRFSTTTGRVDWSVSAFRGIEPFGLFVPSSPAGMLARVYPRFTMIGGDFESVTGHWGVRGEFAAFVDHSFQSEDLRVVPGTSVEAGAGVDRRAGDYRMSGSVLFHRESYDAPLVSGGRIEDGRSDVTVILAADRSFARERYHVRVFGVYGPSEGSAFVRTIASATLRDNLALEGSGGWFGGDGRDLVGRFSDSDFVYLRLKYHF